jgi:ElaB/YqjD/DUF883 family membrane-anchored ribosome-binding protein
MKHTNSNQPQSDLKDEMGEAVQETAESMMGKAGESVAKAGQRVRDAVQDAGHRLGERASNVAHSSRDAAVRAEHGLESAVQARPLTSVLIAAGIGAVVGFALAHELMPKRSRYDNLRSLWS